MTSRPACPRHRRYRRLTRTLYGYAFLDEFVLLYPVYALLFADTGMSLWQISSLFALWSVTGVLLEVPSGAWADAVSRRLLLWIGPLLTAAGFALWVLVPSYGAFALGFVLWGAGGALGSGALEALVYDELDRLGAADRYARVMGRARAARPAGAPMAAIGLAGPVFAWGGYEAVGAASVLACLLTAAAATRFPEHRVRPESSRRGLGATLRAGLAEARGNRSVRGALLLVPAVAAVWGALDEYTPLLVRGHRRRGGDGAVPDPADLGGRHRRQPAGRTGRTPRHDRARGPARGLRARPGRGRRGAHPAGLVLVGPRLRRLPAGGGARRRPSPAPDRRVPAGPPSPPSRAWAPSWPRSPRSACTRCSARALAHSTVFAVLAVPYLVTALALARSSGRHGTTVKSPVPFLTFSKGAELTHLGSSFVSTGLPVAAQL